MVSRLGLVGLLLLKKEFSSKYNGSGYLEDQNLKINSKIKTNYLHFL